MVGQIGRPNNDLEQPNNDLIVDGDVVVRHRGTVPSPGTRIRLDRETGSIFGHNDEGDIVFHWQMPETNLFMGGFGTDGDVVIHNQRASNLMDVNQAVFHLDSQRGAAIIGGNQSPGQIVCRDAANNQTIFLNGAEGDIRAGANGKAGNIFVQNADNEVMIHLNAENAEGAIRIGGANERGQLFIRGNNGRSSIHLDGAGGDGSAGVIRAGGNGSNCEINLFPADANNVTDVEQVAIQLTATPTFADLMLGSPSVRGRLSVWDGGNISFSYSEGDLLMGNDAIGGSIRLMPRAQNVPSDFSPQPSIRLDADFASVGIGGQIDGGLGLSDRFGNNVIVLDAANGTARFGGNEGDDATVSTKSGNVLVRNSANQTTIHLNGETGDGIFQGADCAEDFEIALGAEAAPGTVMVLDADGKLKPSTEPYDKRVVGIVAGAGDLRPGIILGRRSGAANRVPIALFGRTYCKVDATHTPISVGDLLTTASTPGLAMKATDSDAAFGAIVGKAIQSLSDGTGLIQILVTLQ